MSNLKRYSVLPNDSVEFEMVEDSTGPYVKFDDIKELLNTAHNISVMPCLQEQCINFPNGCSQCCHLERPSLSEART